MEVNSPTEGESEPPLRTAVRGGLAATFVDDDEPAIVAAAAEAASASAAAVAAASIAWWRRARLLLALEMSPQPLALLPGYEKCGLAVLRRLRSDLLF